MAIGLTMVPGGFVIAEFESDSPEADASAFIDESFETGQDTVTTVVVLRDTTGADRAISKSALIESLEIQHALIHDERVEPTLEEDAPPISLANVIAFQALAEDGAVEPSPDLAEQIAAIESRDAGTINDLAEQAIEQDDGQIRAALPVGFESVDSGSEAHLFVVTHDRGDPTAESLPEEVIDAQVAIAEIASESDEEFDTFAFGPGIVDEQSGQATGESFALIGPLALVLVLLLLVLAYRDLLDIALNLASIALVLVWMGGFVGWLGIEFTQILIAVPFLLVGLSIDYGLHVVMRYREERERPGADVPRATTIGLAGVIVAIGATTITTSIGFFSNLASPIGSIADFGLLSGLGILSAFIVFGVFLPATKFECERFLEGRGIDRQKRAVGTGGVTSKLLGIGASGAKRAPALVIALVLVVSLAGAYGAVNVDTSIDQNDFLPEDRQAWMEFVPPPFQPGEYQLLEHAQYLDSTFGGAGVGDRAYILVEGSITDPDAFAAIESAGNHAAGKDVTVSFATGDSAVATPLSVIESLAAEHESVEAELEEADSTGDDVPDQDIANVLDTAFAADAEAMSAVVARDSDGAYHAALVDVTIRGDAEGEAIASQLRESALVADASPDVTAIATGQPIILEVVQEDVLRTLVTTFAITLILVGAFLALLFGRQHRSYSLGLITMLPVLGALSWILGMMYLLDIPYNSETAIITGIAIGIGVDFAIHISERYVQERDRVADTHEALMATVRGTGGALLASAMTTVVGFGILALTLIPSLQRFGIVTGLTIAFAWVASVLVLPSLLVLWDRYLADEEVRGTSVTAQDPSN